jgi:hypothetical protein
VMVEVYGEVPAYSGTRRPPTHRCPQPGWQYVQMVKQRENGRVVGIKVRVVFGDPVATLALLGQSTAYIERTQEVGKKQSNTPLRPAKMLAI